MSTATTEILLTLLAFLLCSAAIWRSFLFKRKSDRQAELLAKTSEELADAQSRLVELQQKNKQYAEFQESLSQAEIVTRLQRSRLSVQHDNGDMPPPERYRYVHSLASSGMSSQEISSIMSISPHEARQLVNLARLAHADRR